LDQIIGDSIIIDKGTELTTYQTIGSRSVKLKRVPVLKDEMGPFGSIISDSIRSSITEKSKKMMIVIYDFNAQPFSENLQKEIDEAIFNSFNTNVKKQIFYYEK
jgi:DNA/RNA-binding domain of Phe-tRNA-synthetase-like protein